MSIHEEHFVFQLIFGLKNISVFIILRINRQTKMAGKIKNNVSDLKYVLL